MPTFTHGKSSAFLINNNGAAITAVASARTYNLSNILKEISFPGVIDTAETSAFGTQAKSYVVGLQSATISGSGMWDNAALLDGTSANSTTADAMLAGLIGAAVNPRFAYGPSGVTTALVRYTGEAILTNYTISGSIGDMVAFTVEMQVTGPVTRSAW